jgi:uncharacterized protein YqeY
LENRKESARIFTEQNRLDLAEPELAQIAIMKILTCTIKQPEAVQKIIAETGAVVLHQWVKGLASAQLGGTAEGRMISTIVKNC